MYDRILLPTDGSEASRRAVDEAVALAGLTGATIHGLYVVDTRDYNTLPEAKWLTLEEDLRADGEAAVSAVVTDAERAGVAATTAIERGVPHEAILAYADEHDVDAIVLGTHGRTGIRRFLIGSVAERVVRGATIPVVVVRDGSSGVESD